MKRKILLWIALVLSILLSAVISICVLVVVTFLKIDEVEYSRIMSPDKSMEVVLVYTTPPFLADGRVLAYVVKSGAEVSEDAKFCSILGTYNRFVNADWLSDDAVQLSISRVDVRIEKQDDGALVPDVTGAKYVAIRYKL